MPLPERADGVVFLSDPAPAAGVESGHGASVALYERYGHLLGEPGGLLITFHGGDNGTLQQKMPRRGKHVAALQAGSSAKAWTCPRDAGQVFDARAAQWMFRTWQLLTTRPVH